MTNIHETTNILKEILSEIHNLKSEINTIHQELAEISKSTSNMDNHISFVESVWSIVKTPFSYGLQLYYGKSKNIETITLMSPKMINNISLQS